MVITFPTAGQTLTALTEVCGCSRSCADIIVLIGDLPVLRTKADQRGNWCVAVSANLAPGSHRIRAIACTSCGRKEEEASVEFVIGGQQLAPPVITSPANGEVVSQNPPVISGTGIAGNTVHVCILNVECADVVASIPYGYWQMTPQVLALPAGNYRIQAYQSDTSGAISPMVYSYFTVN